MGWAATRRTRDDERCSDRSRDGGVGFLLQAEILQGQGAVLERNQFRPLDPLEEKSGECVLPPSLCRRVQGGEGKGHAPAVPDHGIDELISSRLRLGIVNHGINPPGRGQDRGLLEVACFKVFDNGVIRLRDQPPVSSCIGRAGGIDCLARFQKALRGPNPGSDRRLLDRKCRHLDLQCLNLLVDLFRDLSLGVGPSVCQVVQFSLEKLDPRRLSGQVPRQFATM